MIALFFCFYEFAFVTAILDWKRKTECFLWSFDLLGVNITMTLNRQKCNRLDNFTLFAPILFEACNFINCHLAEHRSQYAMLCSCKLVVIFFPLVTVSCNFWNILDHKSRSSGWLEFFLTFFCDPRLFLLRLFVQRKLILALYKEKCILTFF